MKDKDTQKIEVRNTALFVAKELLLAEASAQNEKAESFHRVKSVSVDDLLLKAKQIEDFINDGTHYDPTDK